MASATIGLAQQRVESIQEIPYTRLQSIAESTIGFEARSSWSALPKALSDIVEENGVRFAAKFKGQTV
jgi:hypothetical protein